MRRTIRIGKGKGLGRGYKNIIPRHDKRVHEDSGYGRKQPQLKAGMTVISRFTKAQGQVTSENPFTVKYRHKDKLYNRYTAPYLWKKAQLKDTDKDGVPDVVDCDPLDPAKDRDTPISEISESGDILPAGSPTPAKASTTSKILGGIAAGARKAGAYAAKAGRYAAQAGKEYLAERAEREKIRREQELEDIKHPVAVKHKAAVERVRELEHLSESSDDPEKQDEYEEQLGEAREKLEDTEAELENINLAQFTDGELRQLAIRHREGGDDLFSMGGNKYEDELVGRVKYRKQLDAKIREAEKAPLEKEGGLFD